MPTLNDVPRFALLTEVDRRTLNGENLFSRDGGISHVVGAADYFEDELHELMGFGRLTGQDSQALLDAAFGAGNVVMELTEADRFRLYCPNPADTVAITAGAGNATFGFDAAGHGAANSITATTEWSRGNVFNHHIEITYSVGPVVADWPGLPYAVHSAYMLLRERGAVGDNDDNNAADCIEALDQALYGSRISWGMDAECVPWTSFDIFAFIAQPTWSSTAFRDYLGFTGAEASVPYNYVGGGGGLAIEVLHATYPCAGCVSPSRPRTDLNDRSLTTARGSRLTNGEVSAVWVATHRGYSLRYFLDGPADAVPVSRHFVEHWLPYCEPGGRLALYQNWSEPRRSTSDRNATHTTGNDPAYDVYETPEDDGRQGRLLLYRDPADQADVTVTWGQRTMRRGEQQMLLLGRTD
jgi:hypothetical protein